MFAAKQAKEITLKIGNNIGVLHEVSKIVAEKGVNIIGVNGAVCENVAVLRIATDDNVRAMDELREHRYNPEETSAVFVELPNNPGILRRLADRLARAEIDIRHISATAPLSQEKCLIVLSTSDDQEAVVVLNKTP